MERDHHAIEVCHAADGCSPVAIYAHCVCGWTGERRLLTQLTAEDGRDIAVVLAEHEGGEHVQLRI